MILGDGSGIYSTLEDCQLECFNVSVNNQNLENFTIFSNPIKGVLNIDFNDTDSEVIIYVFDAIGNIVFTDKTNTSNELYSINTREFSKGMYFIELKQNNLLKKEKFFSLLKLFRLILNNMLICKYENRNYLGIRYWGYGRCFSLHKKIS